MHYVLNIPFLLVMIQIEHDEGSCIKFYIYLFAGYDTDRT